MKGMLKTMGCSAGLACLGVVGCSSQYQTGRMMFDHSTSPYAGMDLFWDVDKAMTRG